MGVLIGRSTSIVVVLLLVLTGTPVSAQGPSASPAGSAGDMCLLSLEELNELTGLRFVSTATGPTNCTYDSDIADDLYTLDLRVVAPDPTAVEPPEDGLLVVRMQQPDGTDTTIGGWPAWVSQDGLWVDIGDDVFVVQPILFLMADPADATGFLVPVAELALSRLPVEAP